MKQRICNVIVTRVKNLLNSEFSKDKKRLFNSSVISSALVALTVGTTAVSADTLIIRNDPGGRVDHRQTTLQRIRAAGDRVEIRGGYCNSACTMYLGLPNMCISASTVFGFHGPSSSLPRLPLAQKDFEKWSRVMADTYPQPLRRWFMEEARYELRGLKRVRGRDIINMGVPEC